MVHSILAVGLGGFLGAVLRFAMSRLDILKTGKFPWATFSVNMLGSLFLGILYGLAAAQKIVNEQLLLFLGTGIMGSLTTFSTYKLDSLNLIKKGKICTAAFYVVVSVLAGLILVSAGFLIGRAVG